MSESVRAITMPKWGMDAAAGTVNGWLVNEGARVEAGAELAEVETTKIAGVIEAPSSGVLRRLVAPVGASVPVGGLLAVLSGPDVPEAAIEAFVSSFEGPSAEAVDAGAASDLRIVDAGGRPLRVRSLGEGGVPAILVHGFGGDLDSWLFNHAPLAEHRLVHAIELPGHGRSSKDVGDASLRTLVDSLDGALGALGVDHAHLIGHSLGGLVALAFALEHPRRVDSLALLASAGLGADIDGEYITGFVAASRRKELKPVLEKLFADPSKVSRQLIEEVLRNKRLDGAETALGALGQALFPGGCQQAVLAPRLAELARPPLVLWGEADRIVPPAHARALIDCCPVHVLEDAGHMVQMEAAGTVNRLLDEHLGR